MQQFNENGDAVDTKRNILEEIADRTRERVAEKKREVSLEEIKKQALSKKLDRTFLFEAALKKSELGFICEVKKASPSKGLIAADFPYIEIAKEYEEGGAAAISCLTEPYYFQGENRFLEEIVSVVSIPVLRKDFTVDEYMIYEAKVLGASAILLICSILDDRQLKEYFQIADQLGLSVLVETHTEEEVKRALASGARLIGVNNRNLKTFQVDLEHSVALKKMIPDDVIFISESGIKTKEDIKYLHEIGTDAVLIGETFMRASNKRQVLEDLVSLVRG
ncbi:MAG: indole-3-glycerol phosphate synthase TrpC [Eubacteriales bacterium]